MKTAGPQVWRPRDVGYAPLDVDLWNALVSHLGATLSLGNGITCRFDSARHPAPAIAAGLLRLASGQTVVVVPVAFPFSAAYEADLSVADLSTLPTPLRDALTEGIITAAASALPLSTAPEIASCGLLAEFEPAEGSLWFRLTLSGVLCEPIIVDVAASGADIIAIFGGAEMRSIRPELATRLSGTVDATIGYMRVSLADLDRWREGTVVVLDGDTDPRPLQLRTRGRLFRFEPQGDAWRCVTVAGEHREDRAGMAERETDPQKTGRDIGGIDVDIDFDLGRIALPVAEIEGWQAGSIVVLPEVLSADRVGVTLRVNGRAIGAGDLVQIDRRLAVRLSSILL